MASTHSEHRFPAPSSRKDVVNQCREFGACNFLWRNYVGDFRSVELVLHVLHWKYPKNERNKTRLTLAPNRGCLGVLWTYSGSVVVLSWNLTHKNTQTSTQAHACRVTDTDPTVLARHKHTRFAPRTYAFAQRHKSDKNIPVNVAKTTSAALPFLY